MLYKKNDTPALSRELFKEPTSEYRGAPFWAWNCKLEKNELLWQIDQLKKMGFGGFHMHARGGLATKYLGKEFMDMIKACTQKAKDEKMLAWLYDEDRWPSGAAGGYVTKDPSYRAKYLVFSTEKTEFYPREEAVPAGKPYLLACYDISLNTDGTLKAYSVTGEDNDVSGCKWYAYVRTPEPSGKFNGQTYIDTMNKSAIDEFIKVTYEVYKDNVGMYFGDTIPAVFTDEPQVTHKTTLAFANDKSEVHLPWTTGFEVSYRERYGSDIIERLPELVWELPDGRVSRDRYHYHDLACEMFTRAFAANCGAWCKNNSLELTGHMLGEPTLHYQTCVIGEAMRAYPSFGIPGIDMLCDNIELSTAKQAQSVCHQYGKEGVLSELYGVTNWTFDFRGHKFQGDWQAALGVTVRVPHLSWVSMKGAAKRDYPASIGYQSPWYEEYPYIENHFARLNTALTRGKPIVKVGVIHPIESYWLHFGPSENTAAVRSRLDENFKNIVDWLLFGTVDFDFISEALLPELCGGCDGKKLSVGEMQYETIIVPGCETLRSSTADILREFAESGGTVIFAGGMPKYIDAAPSDAICDLYNMSEHAEMERISVLDKLDDVRTVAIKNADASPTDNLIYQMRQDNDVEWLFIAHAKKPVFCDNTDPQEITIQIAGEYEVLVYDTTNGSISPAGYTVKDGSTSLKYTLYANDSILLQLKQTGKRQYIRERKTAGTAREIRIMHTAEVIREEPNVYLLDMAQYSADGGKTYADTEEILRIDKKIREELGYPRADGYDVQPWTIPAEKITRYPWLRFEIESEIDVGCRLAYEEAEEVILNGDAVSVSQNGFFVDHAIKTMDLPMLKAGKNELLIRTPIGKRTSIENYFLLGEFDVRVRGCEKKITAADKKIGFGSIVSQGMPFYGGNVIYKTKVYLPEGCLTVRVNEYRGAAVRVRFDGVDKGIIAFDPFELEIGKVTEGEHDVEFKLFGNRANTFGALHICGDKLEKGSGWFGPTMWYTSGDQWTYDYHFYETGIMSSPIFEIR